MARSILWEIASIAIIASTAAAGPDCDPHLIKAFGGECYDVEVSNGVAYLANYLGGFATVDVSDPTATQLLGTGVANRTVTTVDLDGDRAFLTAYPGISIVDISIPANPAEIHYFTLPDTVWSIDVINNTLFAGTNDGTYIVDVTDSMAPATLGFFVVERGRHVELHGTTAYMASGLGLHIVDVSDFSTPVQIGLFPTLANATCVRVIANTVYVGQESGLLDVVDISDPSDPALVTSFDMGGTFDDVNEMVLEGNRLYVAVNSQGIRVFDVSDPMSPLQSGVLNVLREQGLAVQNSVVYTATIYHGMPIIDAFDPMQPVQLGVYDQLSSTDDVEVIGDIAYVADDSSGFRAVDVSNPSHPVILDTYKVGKGRAHDLVIDGDLAYVAMYAAGLRIVSIADPTNLQEIGSFTAPTKALSVYVKDDLAYVGNSSYTSGSGTLYILDVGDPANPVQIGQFTTTGQFHNILVRDGLAYLAAYTSGLVVVDVSDPATPALATSLSSDPDYKDMSIRGDYLFVAASNVSGNGSIDVINISDPQSFVRNTNVGPLRPLGVEAYGDVLFVANGYDNITIVNISDPPNPVQIASMYSPGHAEILDYKNGRLYVAESRGGLAIFDVSSCALCLGDVNSDATVNVADLFQLLAKWNTNSSNEDLNDDGQVDVADLFMLLSRWGKCTEY